MDYNIRDKVEWTLVFAWEFAKKYGLSLKQAFNYLRRFEGIKFVDRNYGYVHTQSFTSMVDDIAEYCHKNGGALV
ncbi:MAG: DUF3791 domain-containing protein [Bacteroidales bacterium]|nr:DUF3791 domain-containing protein [Bacteroidales bacterium]MCR4561406.1 DUF3791 domain-containing protein [Bacteroidales bacterium]MEE3447407.1 DUF3791 domain-containing protein [Bacteroidales bacterium]